MTLETILEERDGRLHGRYRAVNTADTPIFLFNHLHGEFNAGHFPLDAQGIYVELDQQAPGFDPFPIKSQLIARTGPFPLLPVVGP